MSLEIKKRVITSIILFFFLSLMYYSSFIFVYFLIILFVFSVIEFLNISNLIFKRKFFIKIFTNSLFIFYFLFIFSLLLQFSIFYNLKIILFSILLICIVSDIGGYIFGKKIKGPKLTKISPNKTIAGSVGSLILSSITSIVIFNFLINEITFKTFFLGILISIFVQIGDLFFSYLKRQAKLKNTGNILPGHGGILDRIDGIIFGMPVGLILFIIVH
ncbi:MAG: phosphatidate cytidylyltransferase [Candidatus Pelagibacter sp.]|nr:phosphatidate cytidylyltransferase [Candidatus Pelagibacter sp.]OUW23485.1 MAG: hypothetical protein CBD34_02805 [Rickettsiales bacterium TMED174]